MSIIRPIASAIANPIAANPTTAIDAGAAAAPPSLTCLTFETSDDYVDFGDQSYYAFTDGATNDTPFSVSAFVRFDNLTGIGAVVAKWTSAQRQWIFYRVGSTLQMECYDAGSKIIKQSATVTAGAWFHFALTYDGNELATGMTLYQDAVDVGTPDTTGVYVGLAVRTAPLTVGSYAGGNFLAGRMYDLRMYASELSLSNVQYLATGTGSDPGTPDILHAYLNEGTGTTITDLSANANNGTMNNFGANAWVNTYTGLGT